MKEPAVDRLVGDGLPQNRAPGDRAGIAPKGAGRTRCQARRDAVPPLEPIFQGTGATLADLMGVAQQFTLQGRVLDLRGYGSGNVNDTFLVTVQGAAQPHFILQRLNLHVFRRPELVMANLRTVSEHVDRRLARAPLTAGRRFEVPRVLLTREGRDHVIDSGGAFWRALSFIEAAETVNAIQDTGQAQEVGSALGRFHSLLSDLAPDRLSDTLPGFHMHAGLSGAL